MKALNHTITTKVTADIEDALRRRLGDGWRITGLTANGERTVDDDITIRAVGERVMPIADGLVAHVPIVLSGTWSDGQLAAWRLAFAEPVTAFLHSGSEPPQE